MSKATRRTFNISSPDFIGDTEHERGCTVTTITESQIQVDVRQLLKDCPGDHSTLIRDNLIDVESPTMARV